MRSRNLPRLVRCAVLAIGAGVSGLELWRMHPATAVGTGTDADIVTGCTWVSWAVAGYLVLAILLAVLAAATRADVLARAAPPLVRRVVEVVVSAGLIGALSGGGAATAATAADHAHRPPVVTSMDWPGLAPLHPGHDGRPAEPATTVVVQPGDSLWTVAARHLGPHATSAQVAAAWPQWWRANRHAIGPDPNLILPGLHLTVPTTTGSQP